MFGIGRRRTQGQLARAELNQGIGHLKQAATYAAKGAGTTVGPRVQAARSAVAPTAVLVRDRASTGLASTVAALTPLAVALRNARAEATEKAAAGTKATAAKQSAMNRKVKAKNMKSTRKKSRRSGSMMAGLLAAGAVAGLAGAMAMRRRREQQEWAEYEPAHTLEPMRDEVDTIEVRTRGPAATGSSSTSSGAGGSAVAGGDNASTTATTSPPKITPTDQVPSVAAGAKDVSGRPADDLSKAMSKETARTNGRR